jgi:hypothetical protein
MSDLNLQRFSSNLISFYEELLDTDIEMGDEEFIPERLNDLRSLEEEVNEDNLNALMRSSLHGMCFSLMSGNLATHPRRRGFKLKDEEKLGEIQDLRGQLSGYESDAAPTLFEFLVRGWYVQELGQPLPDLDNSPKFGEGDSNCEFVIEDSENKPNMVECKKLTSFRGSWKQNLRNHFQDAIKDEGKFEDTDEILGLEGAKSHFIVNLTKYSNSEQEVKHSSREIKKKGPDQGVLEEQLDSVLDISRVDQFTIVWNEVYWIDDKPRAVVQKTSKLREDDEVKDYEGWTVLAMTGRLMSSDVADLFLFSGIKPEEWLKFHQDGYDGNAFIQDAPKPTGESEE